MSRGRGNSSKVRGRNGEEGRGEGEGCREGVGGLEAFFLLEGGFP